MREGRWEVKEGREKIGLDRERMGREEEGEIGDGEEEQLSLLNWRLSGSEYHK